MAATGINVRHARSCRTREGGRCNCRPSYQAEVFSVIDGKKVRRSFPTEAAAKTWRVDAQKALRDGAMRAPTSLTLREAADAWLEGARRGSVRNRSGEEYKPSAIRSYERALRLRVLPVFGARRLSDIRRPELQDLVDELVAEGLSSSTIQMTVVPLKSMYRREASRGRIPVNPTTGLELPAIRGGRDRIADPTEAAALLAALPDEDRAVWATAMYAGLRRGELMALRVSRVDLTGNVIRVEKGWDDKEGEIETKGRNRRRVPIPTPLREQLLGHLMRTGRRDADLVFGKTATTPFSAKAVALRADRAWKATNDRLLEEEEAQGREVDPKELLRRITLHECRHSYASLMIAAGVNAKALSTYMGHANISITLDRYGHLMPGNEEQAAGMLDAYLIQAAGTAAS